jgi:hypothetical protein
MRPLDLFYKTYQYIFEIFEQRPPFAGGCDFTRYWSHLSARTWTATPWIKTMAKGAFPYFLRFIIFGIVPSQRIFVA